MLARTYDLNASEGDYQRSVSDLVDELLLIGHRCQGLIDQYARFVASTRGVASSSEELLLEVLMLGVLWRARGHEATMQTPGQRNLVTEIIRERRNLGTKRRDGSQSCLLNFESPFEVGILNPTLLDLTRLRDWLFATGEYDDEVQRLEGWLRFFAEQHSDVEKTLRLIMGLTLEFEASAESKLGRYTTEVDEFLVKHWSRMKGQEDAAQCSRRRLEYHFNLFGAELLNWAWRTDFLNCQQHIVVVSGCVRLKGDESCLSKRSETALHCSHCSDRCLVSMASRVAQRYGKQVVAVVHGSDYTRFLQAARAQGDRVGIVGVACAPGIVGAGLRAKSLGLPAQCVVLNTSSCEHWRARATPNSFSLKELERILRGTNGMTVARRPSVFCSTFAVETTLTEGFAGSRQ